MKKTILYTILSCILLISLASAYNITAGEPFSFDLEEEFEYYSIVGNSTQIDLIVEQDGTIVTITTGKYTQTDSFELIFFNKEREVIYKSGGGGKTKYRDRDIIIEKEVEKIIYVNQTETIELGEPTQPQEKKAVLYGFIILGIMILILIILSIIKSKKRKKENE